MKLKHRYADRVCLVTGAASGVGRGVAVLLGRLGAVVVAADLLSIEETCRAIETAGGTAWGLTIDVASAVSVARAYEELRRRHGRLDYLFHFAGIVSAGLFHESSVSTWERVIATNLLGSMSCALGAFRLMMERRSGTIVLVSSLAGLFGQPISHAYTASKHGVAGFAESLRFEAASFGIGVTLICPGYVDTPIYDHALVEGVDAAAFASGIRSGGLKPISPERAAILSVRAAARRRFRAVFPFHARLLGFCRRFLPFITNLVSRRMLRMFRDLRSGATRSGVR